MKLGRIHSHTIDASLLKNKGEIIDLGCRGFEFAMYFKSLGYNLICVDADPNVFLNYPDGITVINKAVYSERGKTRIIPALTESAYISDVKTFDTGIEIEKCILSDIQPAHDYDILKIDIEGSEYEILSDKNFIPYAKQITVEFHEHTHKELHDRKISDVLNNLKQWYDLVYIMDENEYKYIDTLFIRR